MKDIHVHVLVRWWIHSIAYKTKLKWNNRIACHDLFLFFISQHFPIPLHPHIVDIDTRITILVTMFLYSSGGTAVKVPWGWGPGNQSGGDSWCREGGGGPTPPLHPLHPQWRTGRHQRPPQERRWTAGGWFCPLLQYQKFCYFAMIWLYLSMFYFSRIMFYISFFFLPVYI